MNRFPAASPPLIPKPEKRAVMALQVFRRQRMARMVRKPRIVHPAHQRVGLEKPRNRKGVFGVLPLPEAQGLQPLEELEGVEGAQAGPEIPEPEDPRPQREGDVPHPRQIAEGLPEFEAVVAGIRFGEFRKLAVSPVEFSAVDDDAADRGPVTADELRRGGRQDVGAEIERPHEPHADRVVDHKRDPRPGGRSRRSPRNRGRRPWGFRSFRHRRPASFP